jgi:serine phosphatase RsbU (regulator of sigma subunit)
MTRLLTRILQPLAAGRGRPLATAFLTVFAVLLFFPDHSPFKTLQVTLFDLYQKYMPRERISTPVTIVGIDETSLKELGQWPWPRTRMAALIERITVFQPAAIGIDIIMPEPDRMSPVRLAESLSDINPALRQQLLKLPDNDRVLAAAIARAPSVLGAAGFDYPATTTAATMRAAPIMIRGGNAALFVRHFPAVLKSLPDLENAASGQALLNTDLEKGVVRRIPLIATVGEMLVSSLSLELLRVASGLPAIVVTAGSRGIVHAGLGDIHVPLQANGEAWVHFTPFLPDRYVSAVDVFSGRVNPDMFQRKLVLIGLTGLGLIDAVTTPRGERVPGVEVHAQFLENIFDQRFLTRPVWMPWLELAALLMCGTILLIAIPTFKPRLSIVLALILAALLLACGIFLYHTAGILFDAASLSMSCSVIFTCLLAGTLIETDRNRRAVQRALHAEREAAARVAGEMEAARRIQMGLLPQAATAFPGETRFDLEALIEPAREVGGDLYDFYLLDEKKLFFIVADVSDKGLPASLFMAMTKTAAKSIAAREERDVGKILKRMNAELAKENPEMMFVTAFAAILDVREGSLEYCIAGHEAPWRIDGAGMVSRLKGKGSPPLCVADDPDYSMERIQLVPGDVICVVTDGITEAMNTSGEPYGKARVTGLLEREAALSSTSALVSRLRDDVRAFVGNAEQSDDLVVLIIRWQGLTAD